MSQLPFEFEESPTVSSHCPGCLVPVLEDDKTWTFQQPLPPGHKPPAVVPRAVPTLGLDSRAGSRNGLVPPLPLCYRLKFVRQRWQQSQPGFSRSGRSSPASSCHVILGVAPGCLSPSSGICLPTDFLGAQDSFHQTLFCFH